MKKLLIVTSFIITSLQVCSQQGWVPQRSKYSFRDSVSFTKDVNMLLPLRLQNSFYLGVTPITVNGTELNILDGALVNYTELNHLVGVTSGIQAQINAKANSNNTTLTGTVTLPATTSIGIISAAELGWLDEVTSNIQTQLNGKSASGHNHSGVYEPALGNPGVDGYVLSSTVAGERSWVAQGGVGGGMTYPGAGIALSTGSSWATSITDNSANWNTAYGWGNHASAGYLTSQTSHADVVVDGDFTGQGIMLRGATAGSYSILGDNSANWNTAYSWGNHAGAGYFVGTNSTIRLLFSSSATGLTYTNTTGDFSLTSGYVIPTTTQETNWNTAYGWGNHASAGYEPGLGNPGVSGYLLSSTTGGVRSWVVPPVGMTYPGAGIPLSTGSAWGTSITNNSTDWNTSYSERRQWDGGSTNLVAATGRTSLGATTVGSNIFTLTNPSAISFLRINADNTVTAQSATDFKTSLSLQNVTNESKTTMFTNSSLTGTTTLPSTTSIGTVSSTEIGYLDGVTSAIQTQFDDTVTLGDVALLKHIPFNAQTASYTLVLTDDGKLVTMSVAGANTLTIPPNSSVAFPVGTQITITQIGAGQTTITAGAGVTINSADSYLNLRVQYSSCTIIKRATDTWLCIGDLAE